MSASPPLFGAASLAMQRTLLTMRDALQPVRGPAALLLNPPTSYEWRTVLMYVRCMGGLDADVHLRRVPAVR